MWMTYGSCRMPLPGTLSQIYATNWAILLLLQSIRVLYVSVFTFENGRKIVDCLGMMVALGC